MALMSFIILNFWWLKYAFNVGLKLSRPFSISNKTFYLHLCYVHFHMKLSYCVCASRLDGIRGVITLKFSCLVTRKKRNQLLWIEMTQGKVSLCAVTGGRYTVKKVNSA